MAAVQWIDRPAVEYPECDGQPMAENTLQFQWIVKIQGGLDAQGNLKPTADFRGVYAALIEQWFGHDAASVIPNAAAFARPALFR